MPAGIPLRALPLFLFLHIPKTAGTSAKQIWRQMFGPFYFQFDGAARRQRAGELAVWQEPGFYDRFLMIGGHFAHDHGIVRRTRTARRRVISVAMFRAPAARVASHYDYVRKRPDHGLYKETRDRNLLQSIQEGEAFRRASVNAQLMQVFGTANLDEIEGLLKSGNHIIGRQDAVDAFFDAVSAVSGLLRPPAVPRINIAEQPGPIEAEPAKSQPDYEEAMDLIARLNAAETAFLERFVLRVLVTTSLTPMIRPAAKA